MKKKHIVGFFCVFGLILFCIALTIYWKPVSATRSFHLVPVASNPLTAPGPIRLSSADLSPDGKNLLLSFMPDLKPFDAEELTLHFIFYEQSPSGLVVASFHPTIDWNMWNIPVLGNKPRKLNLTSLGAFDELKVEIEYKSTLIDSRTFLCK